MIEWLFGDKKSQRNQEKKSESKVDNTWAFEYLGQYLNSPLWRTPIINFLQNNCAAFEDSEENSFQYTTIFKKFTQLVTGLIDGMMKQVGISSQLLEECIIYGLKTKRRRLFEQLLICDNFLAFKRVMVKKNKQLEIEAMKQLSQQDSSFKVQQKKSALDLQRMQIQKAIAISQALATKLQQQEQRMIQQALKQSSLQQEKRQAKLERNKQYQKLPQLSPIKPVAFGSLLQQKPLQQLVKNYDNIREETKNVKSIPVQDAQNRKKRLMQQRELLKKKKQQQRKQQLQQFLAGVNSLVFQKTQNLKQQTAEIKPSEEELQRRKNLAKKLKGQLGI